VFDPPQMTVRAPLLMLTVGPVIRMVAPLPFEMVMPTSFTRIIAPVVLLSMIPPVGPGTSLMAIAFCPAVCSTMLGETGSPARARVGMSEGEPHRHPDQMG